MDGWPKEAEAQYFALAGYAEMRHNELSGVLQPYLLVTDLYGKIICAVILILGKIPPGQITLMNQSTPDLILDATLRDLMADVFDFLYEARALILKGKLEVAYPLARRAYESLSLMVACYLEPKLVKRWAAGKEVSNSDVRGVLGKHPLGEVEDKTRELSHLFARYSHPNRKMMAQRRLGEGNEVTLGSIGRPSLAMLADYALKTVNLWFWFGAVVNWMYLPILSEVKPSFKESHDEAANMAKEVVEYLAQQYNRTLAQEQELALQERRRDVVK